MFKNHTGTNKNYFAQELRFQTEIPTKLYLDLSLILLQLLHLTNSQVRKWHLIEKQDGQFSLNGPINVINFSFRIKEKNLNTIIKSLKPI